MKIGLRILLGYFLIVALAALLLGRVFVQEVKPGVRQAMEDTLVDTANILAELARDDLVSGDIADGHFARHVRDLVRRDLGAEIWGFSKRKVSTRVYVTDDKGIVVFDSDDRDVGRDYSRWNDVYLTLRGRYGARSTRTDPNDEASTVMHVAAPIVLRENGRSRIIGVLTVAKPNRAIAPFIARSQGVILRWGFVLLGAALLIGLLAAWWLSRQLGALRRYAHAVTVGERATLPDGAGEFAELGRALETMRDKLEGKQYVEQYVHALTHELKSPLAAIRGGAELLQSGGESMLAADRARFVDTIHAQSARMAEMIDKLLALAAVEHRQRIEKPLPVDLHALAREAAERIAPKYEQKRLRLRIEPARSAGQQGAGQQGTGQHGADAAAAVVQGDAFLLRQSLLNLLDNAADFAPADGEIELRVEHVADEVVVTVSDRGPGVPDYALDRTFERFYSLARPGGGSRSSGLGLCFVAEAMSLHGGTATLENRDGGGAVARLTLPIA